MKKIIIISLIFSSIFLNIFSQNNTDSLNTHISKLIDKKNNLKISKSEKIELLKYGYSIQNKGFILVENENEYLKALISIDSAIAFWILLKDTNNEANIRKFKGLVLGNLNRFEESKKEIFHAISLFEKTNFEFGVAVSQYDMSLVYEMENKLDSALFYQIRAVEFWNKKNDTSRIFVNNTQLMYLYYRLNDYKVAENIQKINKNFLNNKMYYQNILDFYFVSNKIFVGINNNEKAKFYKTKYLEKIKDLENENIYKKSIYDRKKLIEYTD